ncbi:hypothetical protein QNH98_18825 [Myroides sp. mNGS23_01]|nr:hypothetical protein [Myroides sp. mNGS23_01]WHT38983.1 hypothetical protein QNH98_18825 [Myroides sp. mNGS23_01]
MQKIIDQLVKIDRFEKEKGLDLEEIKALNENLEKIYLTFLRHILTFLDLMIMYSGEFLMSKMILWSKMN